MAKKFDLPCGAGQRRTQQHASCHRCCWTAASSGTAGIPHYHNRWKPSGICRWMIVFVCSWLMLSSLLHSHGQMMSSVIVQSHDKHLQSLTGHVSNLTNNRTVYDHRISRCRRCWKPWSPSCCSSWQQFQLRHFPAGCGL